VSGEALAGISLFARLKPDERAGLARLLQPRAYRAGQTIFMQGDPGHGLYLIDQGRVKIMVTSPAGKGLLINTLGPGDFFGELALLDGEPRSADAVARDACRLLLLRRADFLAFVESRPAVAIQLLAVVSRRLRHTTQQMQDVAFSDVPTRLARVLLALAAAHGQPAGEGVSINRRITQSELAEMIGATRESANKWLKAYERQGLLQRQRGFITLLAPEALRQRVY
jgi:CRP/FNR family transcriptional regulator, cyclic AMP receptor protein